MHSRNSLNRYFIQLFVIVLVIAPGTTVLAQTQQADAQALKNVPFLLGGRVKTGQWWTGQNRPTDRPLRTIRESLLRSSRVVVQIKIDKQKSSCLE